MRREGTFGVLPAEIATPLVMVLNELLLNAVEHGFAGAGEAPTDAEVAVISAHRFRRQLHVTRGRQRPGPARGLRPRPADRLGLQIVRALATGELRGTIELRNRAGGGTEAVLVVPLAKR